MTDQTLIHPAERTLGAEICRHYWHTETDHADFAKILAVLHHAGASPNAVLRLLHGEGFKISRIDGASIK